MTHPTCQTALLQRPEGLQKLVGFILFSLILNFAFLRLPSAQEMPSEQTTPTVSTETSDSTDSATVPNSADSAPVDASVFAGDLPVARSDRLRPEQSEP